MYAYVYIYIYIQTYLHIYAYMYIMSSILDTFSIAISEISTRNISICIYITMHLRCSEYTPITVSPWAKECQTPSMTGNGKHTTYRNGDDPGMVLYLFYPHGGFLK